jgi:hypothetical protein
MLSMRRKVIDKGCRWDGKSLAKALDETENHWQRLLMRRKALAKALDETKSTW